MGKKETQLTQLNRVEPTKEKTSYFPTIWNPFSGISEWSIFGNNNEIGDINRFSDDIDNFSEHFRELENNLMKKSNTNGFQEVRSFTTYKQFGKNGKVINNLERGTHYKYDNGKGFIKAVRKEHDGKVNEYTGEFNIKKSQ